MYDHFVVEKAQQIATLILHRPEKPWRHMLLTNQTRPDYIEDSIH